jgi:hypothetical protein
MNAPVIVADKAPWGLGFLENEPKSLGSRANAGLPAKWVWPPMVGSALPRGLP